MRLAVLAAAVLLAYASGIAGGFVWIDHVEIEQAGYRVASADDASRLWSLTLDQYLTRDQGVAESHGGYWRPLYALSISLDWAVFGARPWLYKLENLLWHLLVVWGLFRLASHLFDERVAFWAALLFAVWPLGIHSVTWISGRKDTMCAAFSVWALVALSRDRWAWALVATMAACLCKELAFVVPVAAMLLFWRKKKQWSLLWLCPIAVIVYRVTVLGGFGLNVDRPTDSLIGNVATSANLLWWYLGRMLVPGAPMLSDAWRIADGSYWGDIVSILAIAVLFGLVVRGLIQKRPWAFALAWTAIWLAPATGIVPLRHFRAERYLYPASWGVLLALVLFLRDMRGSVVRLAVPALGLWAGLVTAFSNPTWNSDKTLFADSTDRDPFHIEGWTALSNDALQAEDYGKAIEFGGNAVALSERHDHTGFWAPLVARTNLGLAHYHAGQPILALQQFERVATLHPENSVVQYHVGLAAFAVRDYRRAKRAYEKSRTIRPDDYLTRSNLAATHLRLNEFRACVALLEPLVALRPDDRTNRINLGSVLLVLKEFQRARPHFLYLSERQPSANALAKLAWCQWELGAQAEARRNVARARQLDAKDPTVQHVEKLVKQ